MKYIVTQQDDGVEEIFLFPTAVHHDAFAELVDSYKDQTYGNWQRVFRQPVRAGFVDGNFNCHGVSETLGLQSDPVKDTQLLIQQLNQYW